MTTFDIYAEPKAPRTKVQSKTAKKTPAKSAKAVPVNPKITARMAASWVRKGRAYNP
jgi:hypothetical protein